jgi:hypothetical protein
MVGFEFDLHVRLLVYAHFAGFNVLVSWVPDVKELHEGGENCCLPRSLSAGYP